MSSVKVPRELVVDKVTNGLSYKTETKAVASRMFEDQPVFCYPVVQPIYHSSTYRVPSVEAFNDLKNYVYGRKTNPTVDAVEASINSITDNAAGTLVYSSGVAAVTTALTFFLSPGDHLIAASPLYGPTLTFISGYLKSIGVETTLVGAENWLNEYYKHVRPTTKAIFVETPTNPLLDVIDLDELGKFGQERNILTLVDSTFGPPFVQQPIKYGIDIVIHSCTKYMGGHSDVIAGSITVRRLQHWQQLYSHRVLCGNVLSPFDASLLLRGIKTMFLRVDRGCDNAMELAKFLENQPKVAAVRYPGLSSHPGHALAKKQMRKFGTIITIELEGGYEAAKKVAESTRLFSLAVSLGGVESLVEHPFSMTHGGGADDGGPIKPNMLRLSVGIEDVDDLKRDLLKALALI